MIDINELRKLAQAALVAPDGLSAEWMDRLGQFQESVSPTAIIELLDRLEASEADGLEQARLNGMGSEREAALMAKLEAAEQTVQYYLRIDREKAQIAQRLEAAEKERDNANAAAIGVAIQADDLRAKIEAMEKQEPVAFALYSGWALKSTYLKEHEACEQRDRRQLTADLGGSLEAYRVVPLYTLPGAKGDKK